MKKLFPTLMLSGFVVLVSASFGFAEFSATGVNEFPYFHMGAVIIGGLIIISLKEKYEELYLSEAIGSFALYTIMVAVFTTPFVNIIKSLVD
jgi:hypothetical protein